MTKIVPRCPTVDSLEQKLNLSHEAALAVRKRAKKGFAVDRGVHWSHAVNSFMDELSRLGEFSGAESLYPEKPELYYLNAGDTYASTLIYNYNHNTIRIGCLGDMVGA